MALWLLLWIAPVNAKPEAERHEVQHHGYVFEKWVRDTFFDGYEAPSYTQEWDVAKEVNKKYGGLPVSIKMTKYGSSVDLGDALRQYQINEPFLIIIGYWKQEGDRKRLVNIVGATVTPALWQSLWSPVTLADLTRLDTAVKNRNAEPTQARAEAQRIKRQSPFTKALMTVNPKIDDKHQRRLQCSLKFHLVFERLAPKADPQPQAQPQLFGIPAPGPWLSEPRNAGP